MSKFVIKRLCVWSGVVAVVLFFTGFILSVFIPPLSPALNPEQVANHYQTYSTGIRIGMVFMCISGMFMAPLIGEISAQIKRMKGVPDGLRYAQISANTANAMFFYLPAILFIAIAFRPERPVEMTYMMNDLAWILAILPWGPAFIANVVIATAIFVDQSDSPVFPRWLAYLNIWVALAYLPGGLLPFFKSGPLAWNGILVFWLAATAFIIWFAAMAVGILQAIRGEERDHSATSIAH